MKRKICHKNRWFISIGRTLVWEHSGSGWGEEVYTKILNCEI